MFCNVVFLLDKQPDICCVQGQACCDVWRKSLPLNQMNKFLAFKDDKLGSVLQLLPVILLTDQGKKLHVTRLLDYTFHFIIRQNVVQKKVEYLLINWVNDLKI